MIRNKVVCQSMRNPDLPVSFELHLQQFCYIINGLLIRVVRPDSVVFICSWKTFLLTLRVPYRQHYPISFRKGDVENTTEDAVYVIYNYIYSKFVKLYRCHTRQFIGTRR